MKIAILSIDRALYSTERLVEAAKQRGHEVDVINSAKVTIHVQAAKSSLTYGGEELGDYDGVIARIGASLTFAGTAVLRQFEQQGACALNSATAILLSRDKLSSLQALSSLDIPVPMTLFAHDAAITDELIARAGGAPVVIKLVRGSEGIGVVLAGSTSSARSVIEAFRMSNCDCLVQQYITTADNSDIRCFVIGNEVVAAMQRIGGDDDFRSNLHRGGTAKAVILTERERCLAVRAAGAMGLSVCGVDLLRAATGPMILEVNSSPGLKGIEAISGLDIATKIIMCLEREYAAPAGSE